MPPVHSLDMHIYNSQLDCDKACRITGVSEQSDFNANYDSDCFNVIRKLITAKVAKNDHDPFFVMHAELVNGFLENWFTKMPNVRPFYTVRCNPDRILLRLLTQNTNVGLCCSNRHEVETALNIVNVDRVIYRNPMWTRGNIRHAKECGIRTVVIDSEDDLKRFVTYYPEANIILRVTMDQKVICDHLAKDNLNVEKAADLLRMTKDTPVAIRGISISVRSYCASPMIYTYGVAQCRRLFDIGLEMGHKMDILDMGDGFPSSTATDGLSFDQIAESLQAAFSLFFPSKLFKHVKVIAEPESDAGKIGCIYQINEGFYGAFGCKLLTHSNPICSPLMIFGEKMSTYAAVIGPEPCDTDIVVPLTRLPPLQVVGDWLIWHDMGAYTMGNDGTSDDPSPAIHYCYKSQKTIPFLNSETLQSKDIPSCVMNETDSSSCNLIRESSESELTTHADAANGVGEHFQNTVA
uniref:Orn/DAP/Arg decarboxylase 2 N-terminal domain-containing protein n=1 Tax=Setaria digitata TaxID=48799 RepID=A0A915Q073_9BILA